MGYTIHRWLTVHSFQREAIETAHDKALSIFGSDLVSEIQRATVNRRDGFIVWTSGSKEGWDEATQHQLKVERFIDWLRTQTALFLHWHLVEQPEDNVAEVVACSKPSDFDPESKP